MDQRSQRRVVLIGLIVTLVLCFTSAVSSETNVDDKLAERPRIVIPKLDQELNTTFQSALNNETALNKHVRVSVLLGTRIENLAEIRNKTKNEFSEIREVSDLLKRRFRYVSSELKDDEEGIIQGLRNNDKSAMQTFNNMLRKYNATRDDIANETERLEELRTQKRKYVYNLLHEKFSQIQNTMKIEIEKLPDTYIVSNDYTLNSLIVETKIKHLKNLSEVSGVVGVLHLPIGSPELDVSAYAVGADDWWNGGYDGGSKDVVVIDGGIDLSHSDLGSHDGYEEAFPDTCTTDDTGGSHGTHIAGIIGSEGGTYRGLANGTDEIMNAKLCIWEWEYVLDAVNWSLFEEAESAEVISLSSRWGCDRSGNSQPSLYVDAVVSNYDVVWIKSAGNYPDEVCLDELITTPADAYNIIAVGAINDGGTSSRNNDNITDYSRKGPTDNNRIKPDLTAPGHYIRSTSSEWEGDPQGQDYTAASCDGDDFDDGFDFIEMCGTSMAAPHISAAALLLMDGSVDDPREIMALLINTADDDINGPDPEGHDNTYGYGGYLDLDHAYVHRGDVRIDDVDDSEYVFYGGLEGNEGDKITLAWYRYVAYNDLSSNYLNDLDLSVYDESDVSFIAESDTGYDNREQVILDDDYDKVVVKVYGYDVDNGPEEYALATEEDYSKVNPLSFSTANLHNPSAVVKSSPFEVVAEVPNSGDINAKSVSVTLNLPAGFSINTGANPQSLGYIDDLETKNASWTVTASNLPDDYELSINITSDSYDEIFTGYKSSNITITECSGTNPPSSGDWNITTNTSCSNVNITLAESANLNVIGNVTLSFENVTLTLDNGTLTAYDEGNSNSMIQDILNTIIEWIT